VEPAPANNPVKSLVTGLPPDLRFRTKGQLAIDVLADAYADGLAFDFICGDEVEAPRRRPVKACGISAQKFKRRAFEWAGGK
jgi:hypothetical protein